ncbi:hypothetical protein [Nodosilinea sp. P-1105]|uniref:hypothetical protein n=1 Tax=Nodosilinea sp. P-1105 TaxID=2546229 RepID=UPI00197F6B48|nr:hypothetical protein [Nodosilinea sp. P-1105]
MCWSENGVEVLGKSDCGRATIVALRLNNPLAKAVRHAMDLKKTAGLLPTIP